jgi:hypothetical protein
VRKASRYRETRESERELMGLLLKEREEGREREREREEEREGAQEFEPSLFSVCMLTSAAQAATFNVFQGGTLIKHCFLRQ